MNGDDVLFGLLPFDVTEAAYAFHCPVCDKVRSTDPDAACPDCPTVATPARRRRARKAVS